MLLVLAVIFHSIASVLIKLGAMDMEGYSVVSLLSNHYYWLSLAFLGLQAFVWQMALKKYTLSTAYLFTALYYPLTMINGLFFFSEKLKVTSLVGVGLIAVGVFIKWRSIKLDIS